MKGMFSKLLTKNNALKILGVVTFIGGLIIDEANDYLKEKELEEVIDKRVEQKLNNILMIEKEDQDVWNVNTNSRRL